MRPSKRRGAAAGSRKGGGRQGFHLGKGGDSSWRKVKEGLKRPELRLGEKRRLLCSSDGAVACFDAGKKVGVAGCSKKRAPSGEGTHSTEGE